MLRKALQADEFIRIYKIMKSLMSALFVVIVFAAAVLVYLFVKLPLAGERGALPAPREKILRVGEATFLVEVADTAFQRAQGRGGISSPRQTMMSEMEYQSMGSSKECLPT